MSGCQDDRQGRDVVGSEKPIRKGREREEKLVPASQPCARRNALFPSASGPASPLADSTHQHINPPGPSVAQLISAPIPSLASEAVDEDGTV